MNVNLKHNRVLCSLTVCLLATPLLHGAESGLIAKWSFEGNGPEIARDSAGGITDAVEGTYKQSRGVIGSALHLDGYTTCIVRQASRTPRPEGDITAGAWVALGAYPWNWCPIITQREREDKGFGLSAGPRGQVRFSLSVNGTWHSCESGDFAIPLRRWVHVAGVYDEEAGLSVYVDGRRDGTLEVTGSPEYAYEKDLRIGMDYEAVKPSNIHREHGTLPGWFSLDGMIDQICLYERALSASEIAAQFVAGQPLPDPGLQPRVLPAGPKGLGRFGAYYCRLNYYDEWDALWAVGPDPDVLVRFDESSSRVVFWRGSRYSPAWVAEPGLWMADQSVEAWGVGDADKEGCFEHMQDRRCRYSHVRIIESHDARTVVHWRYAPVSSHDHLWQEDPKTGRACWVDEYYFIYPDVMGVRKVTWKTGTLGHPRQFQESLPFTGPGQLQGDVIQKDFAFVANLRGQSQTLSFVPDPKNSDKQFPDDLTIQMYNFTSDFKPFIIFEPGNKMHYVADRRLGPRGLAVPGACNHWPVGQARCDGRTVQAADRPTHFLGFPISSPPIHEKDGRSWWNGLYGMTDRPIEELITVARSWSQAPKLTIRSHGFTSDGYDRSERAYRIACAEPATNCVLRCRLAAGSESPLCNLPIVVANWGDSGAALKINDTPVDEGRDFRVGHRYRLDSTDLVVWIKLQSTEPVTLELTPTDGAS